MPLLQVSNLEVTFPLRTGASVALHDFSVTLAQGERLGIVGESGAGKSVAAFALLDLVSKPGFVSGGSVIFNGKDLRTLSADALRQVRGNQIAMIFQDPMMTLNPVLSIGTQLEETILAHRRVSRTQAREIAIEKLRAVQIPSPEKRFAQYPHQLSGGMRQRVVIACALLCEPKLVIADEPTTALDVTIQAEILSLLQNLCAQSKLALILISHDLNVVSQVTTQVLVMYAGHLIERGDTARVITAPRHPYTAGLIAALPEKTPAGGKLAQIPGVMPNPNEVPSGCPFHPRCARSQAICTQRMPPLSAGEDAVACHFPLDA